MTILMMMKFMNNLNISQPDPEWDYYEAWQLLHDIKNKIDAGLKLISGISGEEHADYTSDEKLKEILELALAQLENVIENHLTI